MRRPTFAVLGTTGVGMLGSNTMPLFVGVLMAGLAIDEATVGALGSAELAGVAVGGLLVAPLVTRVSLRSAAGCAALASALGYAWASAADGVFALGVARLGAGAGAGAVLAVGNAAASSSEDPDRLFARVTFLGGVFAALLLGLLPLVLDRWGFRAGYLVLVGLVALAAPLLWLLPSRAERRDRARAPLPRRGLGAAVLVAVTLFWMADQALWTFTERIGTGVGLSLERVGFVLAVGTVVGLVGAVAASLLSTRLGRTLPLASGVVAIGAVRVALANASSPGEYAVLQVLWAITFLFVVPYTLGTAAVLDPAGRWAAAASAVGMAGTALGPAPAGWLMAHYGPTGLTWFLAVASLLPLLILLPVSLALDRSGPATLEA